MRAISEWLRKEAARTTRRRRRGSASYATPRRTGDLTGCWGGSPPEIGSTCPRTSSSCLPRAARVCSRVVSVLAVCSRGLLLLQTGEADVGRLKLRAQVVGSDGTEVLVGSDSRLGAPSGGPLGIKPRWFSMRGSSSWRGGCGGVAGTLGQNRRRVIGCQAARRIPQDSMKVRRSERRSRRRSREGSLTSIGVATRSPPLSTVVL